MYILHNISFALLDITSRFERNIVFSVKSAVSAFLRQFSTTQTFFKPCIFEVTDTVVASDNTIIVPFDMFNHDLLHIEISIGQQVRTAVDISTANDD